VQADSSITRRYGGAGLGLAIVKGLVEALGGDMSFTSVLGEGSSFRVRLPFAAGDAQPAAAERDRPAPGPSSPAPFIGGRIRILAAEDNAANRLVLQTLLEPLGVAVTFAENGRQAVEMFSPGAFDLVLLDIHMPEMDGEAALGAVRAHEAALGATPATAYALTADVMAHRLKHYGEIGFDGCIAKPIQPKALFAAIEAALRAARAAGRGRPSADQRRA
jgi:CheY-like chemotaxis protein